MLEHGRDVLQLSFAFFVLLSLTKAQSPPPWTEKFQQAFGQLREGNIVAANHQFDALRKIRTVAKQASHPAAAIFQRTFRANLCYFRAGTQKRLPLSF